MTATLRGRCVDAETGEPLAQCEVRLDGRTGSSVRLEAYKRAYGDFTWEDPENQLTGSDGAFSFTFVPPIPYNYSLSIHREDRVAMGGWWEALEPGTVLDLGDIPLMSGLVVSGRVVDTEGIPLADVGVSLQDSVVGDGIQTNSFAAGRTRPDGTFSLRQRVAPGTWAVRVSGRQLVEPARVILAAEDPTPALDVVVLKAGATPTITGMVVDQRGQPVSGATVRFGHNLFGPSSGAHSRRDGTFVMEKVRGASAEEALYVDKIGYQFLLTEETYRWGASDVTLVLTEGRVLEVLVSDAETGEPVEDYGVVCYVDPMESGRWTSTEAEVQQRGHHEGGLARIPGVRTGTNLLVVKPSDPEYFESRVQMFQMTEGGAARQIVRIHRTVRTVLEVVTADGEPVGSTKVELVRTPGEGPLALAEHASPMGNDFQGDRPMILHEGKTDEAGRVSLAAPARERMALRLLGPGHEPVVYSGFVLDPSRESHRVVVSSGATLQVQVRPPDVLDSFYTDPRTEGASLQPPGFHLNQSGTAFPLDRSSAPLDASGRAELRHIPEGTWDLLFAHNNQVLQVKTVENLKDGELRSVEINLAAFRKGSAGVTVFLNGQPLASANVSAIGTLIDPMGNERSAFGGPQPTTASGQASFSLVPASYKLRVSILSPNGNGWITLPSSERFSVSPGGESDHVFHIQTARARVRVLASDGETPVEGLQLFAANADAEWGGKATTDAEGWAFFEHVPSGTIQLAAFSRDMSDIAVQILHRQRTGEDVERIDLETIDVAGVGQENTVEIVMPRSTGY